MQGMSEYKDIERDGHIIREYNNGMVRDMTTNKIMRPPTSALITPEKANVLQRKRQEKQARLLRERITQAHNANMPTLVKGSAEAFAESGAMLYENIVLNTDAYPRDRLETWEKLGRYAAVLPADIRTVGADADAQPITVNNTVNNTIIQILEDVTRAQSASGSADVVEGKAVDI